MGGTLAADEKDWLYLLDRAGRPQAQVPAPRPLAGICCADDGSAFAAVGSHGEVWWLAPDLMPRWQRPLSRPGIAIAMDPFGQYLAVSDTGGGLILFDRQGKRLVQTEVPRPLQHLSFVPEALVLIGSADLGLVIGLDLQGRCLWRDGLASHVGGLAVNRDGEVALLACYSEGLHGYSLTGTRRESLATPEPSRLVSLNYDGNRILLGGLRNRLLLLQADGQVLADQLMERSLTALALAPLGDAAVVALADGRILGLDLRERPGSG